MRRKVAKAIRSIAVMEVTDYRTHNGRQYQIVNVIDAFTRACLAIRVARKRKALDVIDGPSDLLSRHGVPGHVRSDNGAAFIAKAVQDGIAAVGSQAACIEPGSRWETGYCESFNAKLRDELLNGEVFYALKVANVVVAQWRKDDDTIRPHSSLGYHPPAPDVVIGPPKPSGSAPLNRPAIVTRPTMP